MTFSHGDSHMTFIRNNIPDLVPGKDINHYLPGELEFSSEKKNWRGLLVTQHQYQGRVFDYAIPRTPEHRMVLVKTGAYKGHYSYNNGAFKSFERQQGGWLFAQGYENRTDWHWQAGSNDEEPISFISLNLDSDLLKTTAEANEIDDSNIELRHYINMRDPLMEQFALTLQQEIEEGVALSQTYIDTMTQLLAIHLLRNHCSVRRSIPDIKGKLPSISLQRVLDYINSNLDQSLPLAAMAQLANMSAYHFAKVFRSTVGVAPHQYIITCRMDKAKYLLTTTQWSMMQIALAVGCADSSHFATIFKRMVGVTPSVYRNNFLGKAS
jgi:AraC family transcriptional regulator